MPPEGYGGQYEADNEYDDSMDQKRHRDAFMAGAFENFRAKQGAIPRS